MAQTNDDQQASHLMTVRETAALLRLSQAKVYEMAALNDLPAIRFGRAIRFDRRALDALIRAHAAVWFEEQQAISLDPQ